MTMAKGTAVLNVHKVVSSGMYNIYAGVDNGFVIVSRDENITPVLGYSDTKYDSDNLPDGLKWWLKEITRSMEYYKQNGIAAPSLSANTSITVSPSFVTTKWGQGDPFNQKCPTINSTAVPTGCVATAMSQIMNYYEYPSKGQGVSKYTVGKTSKLKSVADTYDWNDMIDKYMFNSTSGQQEAVATLMFDAGAAAHMTYSANESGANDINAASAFVYNFQYDSLALKYRIRELYSDNEWQDMVYGELEKKNPIFYAASDTINGGHAFLFDGIDTDGKIHVNWGWDSSCDGYYDIMDLSPKGLFDKNTTYHFNSYSSMIFGFKPQSKPDAMDSDIPVLLADHKFAFKPTQYKDSVDISIHGIYNYNYRNFIGKVFLSIKNIAKANADSILFFDLADPKMELGPLEPYYGISFGDTIEHFNLFLPDTSPGTYKICMLAQPMGLTCSDYVRTVGGPIIYTMSIDADGEISFKDGDPTETTGISIVKQNVDGIDKTTRVYDTTGRMVYSAPSASFNVSDVPATGILIIHNGYSVKKILK